MVHLNGHLLCALDIETTGRDPDLHEIYSIAIVPLNEWYMPDKNHRILDLFMKPDLEENIDWEAMKKNNNQDDVIRALREGTDKYEAADYLVDWKNKLNIPEQKLIVPLAQNWAGIDKIFIQKWLGILTYDQVFHFHYRDTMTAALYLNDRAEANNEQIPFPKVGLQYLCSQLGVERNGRSHTALDDAVTVAAVYKKLVEQYIFHIIEPAK